MHAEPHIELVDAEHQSPQLADLREIAGTPVFTADDQRIGALERVISLSDEGGGRYLVVDPGAWRRRLGADRLSIPETFVFAADQDRLILETPLSALPTQQWAEQPSRAGDA